MGKDVTEGRSPHRTLAPDTGGPEAQAHLLRGIADKAKADTQHRFRDLYGCLNVECSSHAGRPESGCGQ